MIAVPIAIQPNHSWNMNITAMYIGSHGASKKANNPLPVKNWRKLARSSSGCELVSRPPVRIAFLKVTPYSLLPNSNSNLPLTRTKICVRTHSSAPIVKSSMTIINVNISNVDWLPLVITRSYSCSIYIAGTSIKKLMNILKKPAVANELWHSFKASCKSDLTSSFTIIYLLSFLNLNEWVYTALFPNIHKVGANIRTYKAT